MTLWEWLVLIIALAIITVGSWLWDKRRARQAWEQRLRQDTWYAERRKEADECHKRQAKERLQEAEVD